MLTQNTKLIICLLCYLFSNQSFADTPIKIAIIIDDLGYTLKYGKASIALPGAITYAILPNAPHSSRLANIAHQNGKEILLHLPMQGIRPDIFEPDTLLANMDEAPFKASVRQLLTSVPHIAGVSNHMGSVLTAMQQPMKWLMQELSQQQHLFFVDSLTSATSQAANIARQHNIPVITRNIFLDSVAEQNHIQQQFDKLLKHARRNGYALAIGHPYPETINVLNQQLPLLDNIKLVNVSELINQQTKQAFVLNQ